MTRLETVIEQVKNARVGESRPWIYDEEGEIKEEAICGEVLYLLDKMLPYEISIDDDMLGELLESDYILADNTYNYGANISNDLDYHIVKDEIDDGYYFICMVHLFGDVRGGYSDYFVCHFDYKDEWMQLEPIYQTKYVDKYVLTICLLSKEYEVYDMTADDHVGYFYECEVEDLLKEIEKWA